MADAVYYIPKVRTYTKLEETINAILDAIDRNSNMWTRKNPSCFHSAVRANLERDRADILSYLSEVKDSLADSRPDVVKCWDYSKTEICPQYVYGQFQSNCTLEMSGLWSRVAMQHQQHDPAGEIWLRGVFQEQTRCFFHETSCKKRVGSLAETMPDLAKEWHPTKNGTLTQMIFHLGDFRRSGGYAPDVDMSGKSSPNNRKKGSGCPCQRACSQKRCE